MWTNLFNTPAHLTSFLRLFADSFHIQSNLVTLLQAPKVSQKHINVPILKENETKTNELEMKNAKNLVNNQDSGNEIIEKAPQPQPTPLSPRSISDRLKQPKLQQKLSEAQKSLSPEPPTSPTPIQQSALAETDRGRVLVRG